mgnify:FL=1
MLILKKSDKILLATQGFRACGRDQRAMKTDEVCGRPLDCFAFALLLVDLICQLI